MIMASSFLAKLAGNRKELVACLESRYTVNHAKSITFASHRRCAKLVAAGSLRWD